MTIKDKSTLQARFEDGDAPTGSDFSNLLDSYPDLVSSGRLTIHPIGVWNMDTTASKNVSPAAGNFASARLVALFVCIKSDQGIASLTGDLDGSCSCQWVPIANQFQLSRLTSGAYDNSNYSGSSNRGYIICLQSEVAA